MAKTGRNDSCPCGSGRKFKKCCLIAQSLKWKEEERVRVARIHQRADELSPKRLETAHQISTPYRNWMVRAVADRVYYRPPDETFHQFLVHLMFTTLSPEWTKKELAKAFADKHILFQWVHNANKYIKETPPVVTVGRMRGHPTSGDMQALLSLADDMYQLAHILSAPEKPLLKRLRDPVSFQGARYEILAASLVARMGFKVTHIDDKSQKRPEFFATKEQTAEVLAVEAKSRHRPGVLGQPIVEATSSGDPGSIKTDVSRLVSEALEQAPGDSAFLIFIDVNLPLSEGDQPSKAQWLVEVPAFLKAQYSADPATLQNLTGVVATNFSWHYDGSGRSHDPQGGILPNPYTKFPLSNDFWHLLARALNEYGRIPDQDVRKMQINERYPDLPPV